MKSKVTRSLFLSMLCALVITAFCGLSMMNGTASASTDPISSLALEDGAYLRLNTQSVDETGIRFRMVMDKQDYLTVTGAESEYSNVTFGILIAPEYYHDIYALNVKENVFGDSAKYYYDGVANTAGKEYIFNLTGNLVDSDIEGQVCFDAAIVDILGVDAGDEANNIALDYRAVGYVIYTLNDVTNYVFVGDDDNVRSMATIAQNAISAYNEQIAELEVDGITEDEQLTIDGLTAKIAMLNGNYIEKVNYQLKSETYSQYVPASDVATTKITVPNTVKALRDTYIASKYEISWTFAGNSVTAGQVIDMPTLTGAYALVGTATNVDDASDVQTVYTKTIIVNTPEINENALSAQGAFTYDMATGNYVSRSSGLKQFFVDSVTNGDFTYTASITTTYMKESGKMYMPGIMIGTGAYDNYITLKGMGGSGRLYVTIRTSDGENYPTSECYISGNLSGADKVGGLTKYTVARLNGTYYIYDYQDKFVCAIDANGIHINGDRTMSYEGSNSASTINARLAAFFAKGSENILGIYTNGYHSGAECEYTWDVDYTLGTASATSYAIGQPTLNGKKPTVVGTAPVYAGNGAWKNSNNSESIHYMLDTVVVNDADFVLTSDVTVESKAGFGGWTGVSLATAKTQRSDKEIADTQTRLLFRINNYDLAIGNKVLSIQGRRSDGYNVNITVTGFNGSIGGNGANSKMTLVKLNDVLYVYDNTDTLVCYLDASGCYGATSNNVVQYSGNTQDWYASQIGYSFFTGTNQLVAGIYTSNYGADHYSTFVNKLTMLRGTEVANNKVNPSA